MKDKNSKLLTDFVKYATSHPDERFWQALRNWVGVDFVEIRKTKENFGKDTFYFEGKLK